jgi:soluble cytochrome b562
VTLYRASGLYPSFAEPDSDERIEVMSISLDEALKRLRRGHIEDAKTAVALLLEATRTPGE